MTADEAFELVKNSKPKIVFLNGRTATGKTTFARRLGQGLGFQVIEMDDVARQDVINPLHLPDNGSVHVEVYKLRNRLDWINTFVHALQKRINYSLDGDKPVVVDGAMPNVTTIKECFDGLPHPAIFFFHPKNGKNYETQITKRFLTSDEKHNAYLPPSFWAMMDKTTFAKFCRTREITPEIVAIIAEFAQFSMHAADERLETMQKNFNDIHIVEI